MRKRAVCPPRMGVLRLVVLALRRKRFLGVWWREAGRTGLPARLRPPLVVYWDCWRKAYLLLGVIPLPSVIVRNSAEKKELLRMWRPTFVAPRPYTPKVCLSLLILEVGTVWVVVVGILLENVLQPCPFTLKLPPPADLDPGNGGGDVSPPP